ncbi:tubulin/FtsZ family protein [Halobacterium sp. CBA1126]|uniref:tubulin/FtsZ family protein n=1 Tax=Halobacterium TaxID=2239 RepID=UPI0012F999E6|nr:tubulin/FtsZ family protein [Halobacterium sp. CBA1126]MUV59472.1 cell division protein [Halobacterium sp. CBA1126]
MRVAAIGVGGAGGRIVDALLEDDGSRDVSYLDGACVLDTDRAALADLNTVPEAARQLFGQAKTSGTGADGDPERATAAFEADRIESRRAAEDIVTAEAAATVLIASLGGGTGAGVTAKLAGALQELYDHPIYAVTVLPAAHEEIPERNPARALQAVDSAVDAQIVFDNDVWLDPDDDITAVAGELNQVLVERLGALFSAGEVAAADTVGQRVVDASEIIATLNEGGLATIGYAEQRLQSEQQSGLEAVLDRIRGLVGSADGAVDEIAAIKTVETTLRRATRGRLTFDCPLDGAASGLLVVAGPPSWLHQSAISDGQSWLAEEIGSVQLRTGDNPLPNSDSLSVLVVFAGIRDAPRIDALRTTDR